MMKARQAFLPARAAIRVNSASCQLFGHCAGVGFADDVSNQVHFAQHLLLVRAVDRIPSIGYGQKSASRQDAGKCVRTTHVPDQAAAEIRRERPNTAVEREGAEDQDGFGIIGIFTPRSFATRIASG